MKKVSRKSVVREVDCVARLGGEEFVIVLVFNPPAKVIQGYLN